METTPSLVAKMERIRTGVFGPKFNAIGAEWQLRIYPNGYSSKGCTDIKSDETTIYCSHFIQIESMNYCQTHFDGNPIIEDYSVTFVTCTSPFKWNDLQNESEMTICVKIWKTGAIEKNEARLVSTIYSDKIKKKK
eukprot:203697_1